MFILCQFVSYIFGLFRSATTLECQAALSRPLTLLTLPSVSETTLSRLLLAELL